MGQTLRERALTVGGETARDARGGKPLVLVVDDRPDNLELMFEVLKNDYKVCMAATGQQAIAYCEYSTPDLVLLDIMMPGMSGFEVCRYLSENRKTSDIPIIFLTAKCDPSEVERGFDEGAVDFITKPINPKIVKSRVRTHLTLKFQSEHLRSLALTDPLTGIANRRQFDFTLANEWRRCGRSRQPLSLIMADIDFFRATCIICGRIDFFLRC